nr:hypothetical protein [uncultured Dysosmobacter sp.]
MRNKKAIKVIKSMLACEKAECFGNCEDCSNTIPSSEEKIKAFRAALAALLEVSK